MDTKTIFVLTAKGQDEVSNRTSFLYGDIKRALSMIDGVSSFAEITKRAAPSLRSVFAELSTELLRSGFIQDKARASFGMKIVNPASSMVNTASNQSRGADGELDFTSLLHIPSAEALRAEGAKALASKLAKSEAEQRIQKELDFARQAQEEAKVLAEQVRLKAERDALQIKDVAERRAQAQLEFARLKAVQDAEVAKREAELVKQKLEFEARAREFAERRAMVEAEAERVKVEQEKLRVQRELDAARLKAEAEQRARAEAEQRARAEAEQRARAEAEQRAKAEAEQRAKAEAEQRAKAEAEQRARVEAEQRAKAEAEQRARAEAEQRARAEAERLRLEAEIRLQAELLAKQAQEAADRLKKQAEIAAAAAKAEAERIKQEAAIQARVAEAALLQARLEAEAIRLQAEQETLRVQAELEAARQKAELENKARIEAEQARLAAEQAAIQARTLAAQMLIRESEAAQQVLEKQAFRVREDEQKRAKQAALAAAGTAAAGVKHASELTAAIKLDSFDLDALVVKPAIQPVVVNSNHPSADEHSNQTATVKNDAFQPTAEKMDTYPSASNEQTKQQTSNEHMTQQTLIEQVKKAEEERALEQEAARKLAAAQAKAWNDAEHRAIEAAKAQVEYMSKQQAEQVVQMNKQDKKKFRAARARRKPLPWGGIVVALLVLIVLGIFFVPKMLPNRQYASKLESVLAEKLHQPVHIGKFSARILPTPRIDLDEFYIGDYKQIKVQQVRLNFNYSTLFNSVKIIDRVDLYGAEFNGHGLLDIPVWIQQLSSDSNYPVMRLDFNLARLNEDAVQLIDLGGQVNFDSAGQFKNAALKANAGKFALDVSLTDDHKKLALLTVHNSALPLLPNWSFDDLSVKGELSDEGFVIDDFDGRIAGGILQGDARIGWKSGWDAQGSLNAKAISLTSINKLLEGNMDGAASFKMQADTLTKLVDSALLEGNFIAKKGIVNGIDIVEVARLHSKVNLPGGRTHFDEISGAFAYSNNIFRLKSAKVSNSVLSSTASFEISKQQLTGRVLAHLSIQEGSGVVELQLGGATDNPTLHTVH
jgi:hypothetical protein